jgi:acetamidase/formamidase
MRAETHELKLIPANVHWGYYDARLKPVLKIASGDTVRVETMLAGGLERLQLAGVPDAEIPDSLKRIESSVTDRGPGAHPLTGPIYVEGAEPGDIVEVKILGFEFLHPYGVTGFRPGTGTLPDDFPYARFKRIPIDSKAGAAEFGPGITLKLAPFWGSIGVAPPPLIRRLSSGPPGAHAGNLDNKELSQAPRWFTGPRSGRPYFDFSLPCRETGEADGSGLSAGTVCDICPQVKADPVAARETPTHFIAWVIPTE